MSKDEKLKMLLEENWKAVQQSVVSLQQSVDKCKQIGIKENYSFEESESFDSLTSKFARTADIFTQKILKNIVILLREEANTFVDRANLAEKLDIIPSAEELIVMRDVRNQIAHEYFMEQIKVLYESVLDLAPALIATIDQAASYVKKLKKQ